MLMVRCGERDGETGGVAGGRSACEAPALGCCWCCATRGKNCSSKSNRDIYGTGGANDDSIRNGKGKAVFSNLLIY